MIKFFLFVIGCFAFYQSSSQTVIRVYSKTEGNSLPYASIANLTQNKMYSANSTGELSLDCNAGDTLSVSFVGYHTKKILAEGSGVQKIGMEAAIRILPTVNIISCARYKQVYISNSELLKEPDFKSGPVFGGFEIGASNVTGVEKMAFLLKTDYKQATLTSFSFYTKKRSFSTSKLAKSTPMIISFYEVEDSSGKPSKLLVNDPFLYIPKEYGKQTLKLEKINIQIPEKGIYIGFQFVSSEQSKSEMKSKTELGKDSTVISYGGMLEGVSSTPSKSFSYFDVRNDIWYSPLFRRGQVRYAATIKVCQD